MKLTKAQITSRKRKRARFKRIRYAVKLMLTKGAKDEKLLRVLEAYWKDERGGIPGSV